MDFSGCAGLDISILQIAYMPFPRKFSLIQNHEVIRVFDSLDAMCDRDDGGLLQLLPDNLLNFERSLLVNRSSSLIENDNRTASQHGSGKGNELTLALAEIPSTGLNVCF